MYNHHGIIGDGNGDAKMPSFLHKCEQVGNTTIKLNHGFLNGDKTLYHTCFFGVTFLHAMPQYSKPLNVVVAYSKVAK